MNVRRSSVTLTAIALAIAIVALSLGTGCTTEVVTSGPGTAVNTVTATGTGTASATPDEATMSFGVETRDADARTALNSASKTAEKITSAIKAKGVDAQDIQTQNVSVYPVYDNDGRRITGYQAGLSVSAKITDLGSLGDVIAAATNAGAVNVSGPSFGVADDASYREDAIKKAVDDARVNASAMAKAAGKSVGEVVQISASNASVQPYPLAYAETDAKAMAAGSVPIEAGQLDVNADVTVVFELK